MAVFKSKYRELSFYVKGRRYSFSGGLFTSDDAEVVAVLEKLTDAVRVDEPKPEVTAAETATTEEAVQKPQKGRKSSGK